MKYCPECGYANDYDNSYCDYCGIRLEETVIENELNIDNSFFIRNIILAVILFGVIGFIPSLLNLTNNSFISYLTIFIPPLLFGFIYSAQIKRNMNYKRRLFAYILTAVLSSILIYLLGFNIILLFIILSIAACMLGEGFYRIMFFISEDF